MNFLYPVIGLWLSFLFAVAGYLFRKKKYARVFHGIAIAAISITFLLFLWWAFFRTLGFISG